MIFGFTRNGLVDRLSKLRTRFAVIQQRAESRMQDFDLAIRMGVSSGETFATVEEIFVKAGEQAKTCLDAIILLTVERASPTIFRGATKRAEKFATLCEGILNQIDVAAKAGERAARNLLGQAK